VPFAGGERAAVAALSRFVKERLPLYAEGRNEPGHDVTSGLSPYLHFGHVSAHQVLDGLARAEGWSFAREFPKPSGKREGWWGMSAGAEAFLDQLVTWRELGLNYAALRDDQTEYASLPAWARATLDAHRSDPRPYRYTFDQLERAATHDDIWNAAQRQLRLEGRIHNYLRMLWAKNVLQWSATPEEAAATLIALNDRWAIDGRDPNSYSGIFWTFGRYDRPWPERPVLGTIRAMTSESTRRKLDVGPYLERYGGQASLPLA
jgi:deoxyribodipyrimidine photo-lyase